MKRGQALFATGVWIMSLGAACALDYVSMNDGAVAQPPTLLSGVDTARSNVRTAIRDARRHMNELRAKANAVSRSGALTAATQAETAMRAKLSAIQQDLGNVMTTTARATELLQRDSDWPAVGLELGEAGDQGTMAARLCRQMKQSRSEMETAFRQCHQAAGSAGGIQDDKLEVDLLKLFIYANCATNMNRLENLHAAAASDPPAQALYANGIKELKKIAVEAKAVSARASVDAGALRGMLDTARQMCAQADAEVEKVRQAAEARAQLVRRRQKENNDVIQRRRDEIAKWDEKLRKQKLAYAEREARVDDMQYTQQARQQMKDDMAVIKSNQRKIDDRVEQLRGNIDTHLTMDEQLREELKLLGELRTLSDALEEGETSGAPAGVNLLGTGVGGNRGP